MILGPSTDDLAARLADDLAHQREKADLELAKAAALVEQLRLPIPMLLVCPTCYERHIDVGEFATKSHHTHACQRCGMVWRPALVATVGVRFLPGFKNEPPPASNEVPPVSMGVWW